MRNLKFLHQNLGDMNQLKCAEECLKSICPMFYPLITSRSAELRQMLIGNKIFVATYWPNENYISEESVIIEHYFVDNILPLPCDQRCNIDDLNKLLSKITIYYNANGIINTKKTK